MQGLERDGEEPSIVAAVVKPALQPGLLAVAEAWRPRKNVEASSVGRL